MLNIVSPGLNNPNKVTANAWVPEIICALTKESSVLKISE